MKNKLKHIFFASALMAAATNFTACSLDVFTTDYYSIFYR